MKTNPENDLIRLRHALEYAQKAQWFAQGHTRESLEYDEGLQLILARLLEVTGEAAGSVTPEFRALYPKLPWARMKAMRNWLAHVYFDINLDILWNVVTNLLPPLIVQLEDILNSKEDPSSFH